MQKARKQRNPRTNNETQPEEVIAVPITPKESMSIIANPNMSRRSFFSLSAVVGAVAFLGSVFTPHGTLISAWADEEEHIHFSIYILGRDELPILCFDLTNSTKTPVQGMHVAIKSLNNDEIATADTNKDGFTTVHIKKLSQQANDDAASVYSFFGSVAAEKTASASTTAPRHTWQPAFLHHRTASTATRWKFLPTRWPAPTFTCAKLLWIALTFNTPTPSV